MPYGLYLSADGVNVQSKRLEVLANNLANVDTVGFKRELALFQARMSEADAQGLDTPGSRTVNDIGGGTRFFATQTDYSQGPVNHTGNPTDVAILGDAFFQVDQGGRTMLTRAGNFSFDSNGRLVTQQGHAVLNTSGAAVTIDPQLGPAEIGDDTVVYQFGADGRRTAVSDVALVRPASPGDLVKQGENLFSPLTAPGLVPPEQRRVRSGFVERSAVEPTLEMMELIEASRAMEANVNMIRNHDQLLGNLVNRVLRQA
jgi:flagellar basal-body rod protein FlgF